VIVARCGRSAEEAAGRAAFDEWLYAQEFSGMSEQQILCAIQEKLLEMGNPTEQWTEHDSVVR
jgi:hypothetical protein